MYTSEKVSLCIPYDCPFDRAWENGNSKSVNGIRELLKGIHVSDNQFVPVYCMKYLKLRQKECLHEWMTC